MAEKSNFAKWCEGQGYLVEGSVINTNTPEERAAMAGRASLLKARPAKHYGDRGEHLGGLRITRKEAMLLARNTLRNAMADIREITGDMEQGYIGGSRCEPRLRRVIFRARELAAAVHPDFFGDMSVELADELNLCGDQDVVVEAWNYFGLGLGLGDPPSEDAAPADQGDDICGKCPVCGKNDGYANVGKVQCGFCKEHKKVWPFGCKIFSSWAHETDKDRARTEAMLADYEWPN